VARTPRNRAGAPDQALKILFVTSNRVGDAILSTGLLDHLIRSYPKARITVACGPPAVSLFSACPPVDEVISFEKRGRGRHWLSLWRHCVASYWNVVVDLRGSALSWLLAHGRHHVLRTGSDKRRHRVESLGALLGLDPAPAPTVWLQPQHRAEADRLLPDGPIVALGPTANWGGKQWPEERFLDLAMRLTGPKGSMKGAAVAVFGAEGEGAMVSTLLGGLSPDRAIDLIGKTDLPTAAACLARCSLFVGNDSGLMHLAAAAGVPTLGLFGPSPEQHYAPWGRRAAFVRTPESFEEIINAPDYDYRSQVTRMGSLSVDAVEAAVGALLDQPLGPEG